jgi:L-fuculose-phosphate aldolase
MTEIEMREAIKKAGVELVEKNLVQGTWGNISMRIDENFMLVTPSGLDYIRLTPNDMVKVNIHTLEYEGDIKPTSEKKIHAAILRDRPEINVAIHTHSVNCSSVAASQREMPEMTADMKNHLGGSVRVGPYGLPGTKKLTNGTLLAIKGRNACLMANHGAMVCGTSIEDAMLNCQIMEESAKLFVERETKILSKKSEFSTADMFELFRNRKSIGL